MQVVDINSGPSFYHEHKWPAWFVRERSALTREVRAASFPAHSLPYFCLLYSLRLPMLLPPHPLPLPLPCFSPNFPLLIVSSLSPSLLLSAPGGQLRCVHCFNLAPACKLPLPPISYPPSPPQLSYRSRGSPRRPPFDR